MADTRNYTGIDAGVFTCIKDAFTALKMDVPAGNAGDITVRYPAVVNIHFDWDEADALALRIDGKPSFIPEAQVWALMDESVVPCGGVVV